MKVLAIVFAWSLLIRIAVQIAAAVHGIHHDYGTYPSVGTPRTEGIWFQWDTAYYQEIVTLGYHTVGPIDISNADGVYSQAAFYPGFPLVAWCVWRIFEPLGLGPFAGMLLTNQVLAFAAGIFTFRLGRDLNGGDDRAGFLSLWALLLYPFAFFMLAGYTEALLITALAGFLWALTNQRWRAAAMFGAICSLTRSEYVLLPLVMAVAYFDHHGWRLASLRRPTWLWCLVPAAGWLAYAIYNDDIFASFLFANHIEATVWGRHLSFNLWKAFSSTWQGYAVLTLGRPGGIPVEIYNLPIIIVSVLSIVLVWRRYGRAMGLVVFIFTLIPLATAESLSFNRFALALLPAFVLFGQSLRRWPIAALYGVLGTGLLLTGAILFTQGSWVG